MMKLLQNYTRIAHKLYELYTNCNELYTNYNELHKLHSNYKIQLLFYLLLIYIHEDISNNIN